MKLLQLIENTTAHLMNQINKFDHIIPALQILHWLPVTHCITHMITMLVCKCLHGTVPSYLVGDIVPLTTTAGRRHWCSVDIGMLVIPHTRTSLGARTFANHGPTVWNSLPVYLRTTSFSAASFCRMLKYICMYGILNHCWSFTGDSV